MNYYQIIFITFVLSGGVHIYWFYIHSFITKNNIRSLYSFVSVIFSWITVSLFLVVIFIIRFKTGEENILLKQTVLQTLIYSVFPLYAFTIKPFIYLLQNKNERLFYYEKWIESMGYKYKILRINFNVKNAFAIGLLKKGKIILIGKPLLDNMNEDSIKSLILHEVGHHQKKHLYKILRNVLIASFISALVLIYTKELFKGTSFEFLNLMFNSAFVGLFFYYLLFFQKPMEFEADLFASKIISKEKYLSCLLEFAGILKRDLDKKSISHPTFNERISKVTNS